jgi:hypothetical protein
MRACRLTLVPALGQGWWALLVAGVEGAVNFATRISAVVTWSGTKALFGRKIWIEILVERRPSSKVLRSRRRRMIQTIVEMSI